eukprot:15445698-Alexandrium_andersonii.AAC.1
MGMRGKVQLAGQGMRHYQQQRAGSMIAARAKQQLQKASKGKQSQNETQKLTQDCTRLRQRLMHVQAKSTSLLNRLENGKDPTWTWANTDHVGGKLRKVFDELQTKVNEFKLNDVLKYDAKGWLRCSFNCQL